MTAYYNEFDPYAAQWLKNLIADGLIAQGDVDERSITEVSADDLAGYTQCHFFAGIGLWSLALRNAGWPDDRPVWTGSCPCQPFSTAGRKEALDDDRHLFPAWFSLISQHRPPTIFGEQVARKNGLAWFDTVSSELETINYAVGMAVTSAGGLGAAHIRERQYFLAQRMADSYSHVPTSVSGNWSEPLSTAGGRAYYQSSGRSPLHQLQKWQSLKHPLNDCDFLEGLDNLWRPVERGTLPLAYDHPKRVDQLRAIGNAIVPAQAEHFIRAAMEVICE